MSRAGACLLVPSTTTGRGSNVPHRLHRALVSAPGRRPQARHSALSQAERPEFGGIAATILYRSSDHTGTLWSLGSLDADSAAAASRDGRQKEASASASDTCAAAFPP